MANDHKFGQDDPLEHPGANNSGAEYIQESTMIPESGLVLPEEHDHQDDGPQIVGADDQHGKNGKGGKSDRTDHGDAIPESTSSAPSELPSAEKSKIEGVKKNLPMVIFGVIAAGLIGVVGVKALSSSDATQAVAQPAPVTTSSVVKPVPAVLVTPKEIVAPVAPVAPVETVAVVSIPATSASSPSTGVQVTQTVQTQTSPVNPVVSTPVVAPVVVASASSGANDIYATKGMNLPVATQAPVTTVTTVTTVAPVTAAAAVIPATTGSVPTTPAAPVTSKADISPVPVSPAASVVCEPAAKPAHKKSAHAGSAAHHKTKAKKSVPDAPLPSTSGYKFHMGANGLAWVSLPTGETQIVSKGDRIEGLGIVKEIDLRAHAIRVGRVTLR